MNAIERAKPQVTELFRIVVALMFTLHGTATLFSFMGTPKSGKAPELFAWPGWWAAMIQLICGALVLLGLGTRVAALLCSGSMAYAYFVVHQPHGLSPLENNGELSAIYCWAFFLIAVIGPGIWSLDTILGKNKAKDNDAALAAA